MDNTNEEYLMGKAFAPVAFDMSKFDGHCPQCGRWASKSGKMVWCDNNDHEHWEITDGDMCETTLIMSRCDAITKLSPI